jgi:hypothetical protein
MGGRFQEQEMGHLSTAVGFRIVESVLTPWPLRFFHPNGGFSLVFSGNTCDRQTCMKVEVAAV